MTKEEIKKELEQAQKALRSAEKMGIEKFVTKAKEKIAKLEAELAATSDETEAEALEQKKEAAPKKKGKAKGKKPAMGKGMKQIMKENNSKPTKIVKGKESEESHKSVDTDKKWKYNSTVKKVSDDNYLIYFQGDHTKDAEIKFSNGEWDLICKEIGKNYPKFKKSQVEMAINFVLEVKDCIHSKVSRMEQAKKISQKNKKYQALSESTKAANAVDKAAESVENRVEEAKKEGKSISTAVANDIIVDVKTIVSAIKSGLKENAERKEFIEKLIAELKKML